MNLPRILLAILMLTYFGWSAHYVNLRYLTFETGAYDLGVYAQPIWNALQGRGFDISLLDEVSLRWGIHVEPILWLILPLYVLWPDPRLLLWLQVGGVTLAALPMYALAVRRLQSEWAALIIVMAYFLMPATQSVTLFDFHAVSLAPLFLLTALYFLDLALTAHGSSLWLNHSRTTHHAPRTPTSYLLLPTAYLFLLLALATKEDISLNVFMLGLYLLILRRRWREGGPLIVGSLIWFYVAFQLIIPTYRTGQAESIYIDWFEALGRTPLDIALSPLTKPDVVLALLIKPDSLPALLMLLVPLALLPLAGWPFLLMTAPSLAIILLSSNPTLRQLETWHYAAPMLPFLMLATIDGLARLMPLIPTFSHRKGELVSPLLGRAVNFCQNRADIRSATALAVATFWRQLKQSHSKALELNGPAPLGGTGGGRDSANLTPSPTRGKEGRGGGQPLLKRPIGVAFNRFILLLTMLTVALTYHHYRGYSPLSTLCEPLEMTAHHQRGHQIATMIPAEASVLAQAQLVPQLAHRPDLAIWSGPLQTDYDYIFLDVSHPKLPNRENAHGDLLSGLAIETNYGFVAIDDGYMLLQKGAERVPTSAEFFTFTEFEQIPPAAQPFDATFGDTFKLVAVKPEVRRLATSETEPQIVLYFELLQPPAHDYHLFIYRLNQQGDVVGATTYPQPALFWWPTSRWQAGDRRQVRVNTIPWWTGDDAVFGYALGISQVDDPWQSAARLTAKSLNPPSSLPLDQNTLLPIAAFERRFGLPYPQPLTIIKPHD